MQLSFQEQFYTMCKTDLRRFRWHGQPLNNNNIIYIYIKLVAKYDQFSVLKHIHIWHLIIMYFPCWIPVRGIVLQSTRNFQ